MESRGSAEGVETETILVGGVRGGSKATEIGERYISCGHP